MQNTGALPVTGEAQAILVLDDDLQVLRSVSRMLGSLGYTAVYQASSCEQALEIWRSNLDRIKLFISDFVMPRKTGDLIAAEMRKDNPSLKVLFMSGNDPHSLDSVIALQSGVNYLQKPFSLSEIQHSVERLFLSA